MVIIGHPYLVYILRNGHLVLKVCGELLFLVHRRDGAVL